jgi:hypothetical protein
LLSVRLDYVMQVDEFIGHAKLWESDILHFLVDFDPVSLTSGPFLLDFSVRFLSHFFPILSHFPYAIKTTFLQHPNVMLFFILAWLDCTNVVEFLYGLLCFIVPPLHIFARRKCHVCVFLEINYSCSK